MKYTTLGNCPFCDADMQNGISGGWGMSPEGWTQMKKKHDDVHPENTPVSPTPTYET